MNQPKTLPCASAKPPISKGEFLALGQCLKCLKQDGARVRRLLALKALLVALVCEAKAAKAAIPGHPLVEEQAKWTGINA